jgi:hypothetical protein
VIFTSPILLAYDLHGNGINRSVFEIRGRVNKGLANVFGLKLRVVAMQIIPLRIFGDGFHNAADSQPHASNAWLPVHFSRVPGDSV